MGGSGKWMKALIGHRKSEKEDNVSTKIGILFPQLVFLVLLISKLRNGVCLFVFSLTGEVG